MDEASINQALLMSTLGKYPVVINDRWVAWANQIITKKMALAFLTKLHSGPLPGHIQNLLLDDYKQYADELPEERRDLPRDSGMYWNFHTRQHVSRDYPEYPAEWFQRLYYPIQLSMTETGANGEIKVVVLDADYKKVAIERLFLHD
jgi:hypothetical protein